ncbi:hypothetical protein [Celeribacter sp. ULVN23_4]
MAVLDAREMRGDHYLIEDLRAALDMARIGDSAREEELTDRIRDASYDMEMRHAGYLVRSACGAIDAVLRAFDREGSLAFAELEINKAQDMFRRLGGQASAA